MRLENVTAELRPRTDWEGADLGMAMVRRDFWRCWLVWWLALAVPGIGLALGLGQRPMLALFLFWWIKPMGSRLVLFQLSRRLFGESPKWRAIWREVPRAWVRRFFHRFLWARLSPWQPVAMAVEDLEGLRGKAFRQRCGQIARRGDNVVMWLYLLGDLAAAWLGFVILLMVVLFIPEGQDGDWMMMLELWNPDAPFDIPLVIMQSVSACMAVAMSLTDLYVTGAGFGVYLNNRSWLEGWDVELGLKRIAARISQNHAA